MCPTLFGARSLKASQIYCVILLCETLLRGELTKTSIKSNTLTYLPTLSWTSRFVVALHFGWPAAEFCMYDYTDASQRVSDNRFTHAALLWLTTMNWNRDNDNKLWDFTELNVSLKSSSQGKSSADLRPYEMVDVCLASMDALHVPSLDSFVFSWWRDLEVNLELQLHNIHPFNSFLYPI